MRAVWGIGYIKRKIHGRTSKYKDETSTDKAARRTASATVWMAIFTCVLVIFTGATFLEIHNGGKDTHDLAIAAGKQADAAKSLADQAKAQTDKMTALAQQASVANNLSEESIRGRIAITNMRLQNPVSVGSKVAIVVETDNTGHSSAFERSGTKKVRGEGLPAGDMPATISTVEDASVREPGSPGLFVIRDEEPITQAFLDEMTKKKTGYKTVFFFGKIVYETLGREHYTEFCAYLMPFDTTEMSLPDIKATARFKLDSHYALRQCPKWHGAN